MSDYRESHGSSGRSSSNWMRRGIIFLLVLAVLVALAPQIITKTALKETLISRVTADYPFQISVESLSVGWFSQVKATNVQLRDSQGELLLRVPQLTMDRTLLDLASNQQDLGRVTLQQVQTDLKLNKATHNWQTFLSDLANMPAGESKPVDIEVVVADSTIQVHDLMRDRNWQLTPCQAMLSIKQSLVQQVQWQTNISRISGGVPQITPASLSVSETTLSTVDVNVPSLSGSMQFPEIDSQQPSSSAPVSQPLSADNTSPADSGRLTKATIQAHEFPLELAEVILLHLQQPYAIKGKLTLSGQWQGSLQENELQTIIQQLQLTELKAEQVSFSAPEYLGEEVLQAERIIGQGEVLFQGSELTLNNCSLQTDFAAISADGVLPLDSINLSDLENILTRDRWSLSAKLNLAKLTQILPQTMQLHAGTEIQSGELTCNLNSEVIDGALRIRGALTSTDLVARRGHQEIRWTDPVALSLEVWKEQTGWKLKQLLANSNFIQANMTATETAGNYQLATNLSHLHQQLNQFFQLSGWQMQGELDLLGNWGKVQQAYQVQGELTSDAFVLHIPQVIQWTEQKLRLIYDVQFGWENQQWLVKQVQGQLSTEADQLDVTLLSELSLNQGKSLIPVTVKWQGDLARWKPRLQWILPLQTWNLAGTGTIRADVSLTPQQVTCQNLDCKLTNLVVQNSSLNIQEPQLQLAGSLQWDRTQNILTCQSLTCASVSVAFLADPLTVNLSPADFYGGRGSGVPCQSGKVVEVVSQPC